MWHSAYLLPLFLQIDQYVVGATPLCACSQCFCFLHQFLFLGQVGIEFLLELAEELGFLLKESVASFAEALEYLCVDLLWCIAYGLPLSLQRDDSLCHCIPVGKGLQSVGLLGFQLLAEGCLLGQILFLGLLDSLEVSLMTFVDHGGSVLEACPQLLAYLLGYGSGLLPFLVQLLKLVECLYHVGHFGQCLCLLAQTGLGFQVLLEVIVAQLMTQFQQVIELFYVELVILPQFGSLLGRYGLYLLPLGLQSLHLVVGLVGFVGCGSQLLYALQNLKFALQVLLLLHLLLLQQCSTALSDGLHGSSEDGLLCIHWWLEGLFGATGSKVLFACLDGFGIVELVEELLQKVQLLLVRSLACLHYLPGSCHHLFLGLVYIGSGCGLAFGCCLFHSHLL